MTGTEIYKRTPAYEREAREIRLHAPHWKLLLAFDGQRSLSEVAMSAEISFADTLPLVDKFLGHGWIEEQPITLEQYLKRMGAREVSAAGSAVAPATVLHEPRRETARLPSPPPALPVSAATPKMAEPAASPEKGPEVKSARRPMRLSAVVDFITSLVGNIAIGQLLVYRVFLRVPPELLLAEEVASVHLVDDTSLIRGEKLQAAIAEAIFSITKRSLPESVFASA